MSYLKNAYHIYTSLLLFVLGGLSGAIYAQNFNQDIQKLQYAYKLISTFYVDTVDKDKLVEDAIKGMLKDLDPHSEYLSKEEVIQMNEPLYGSFEGIGIQFNIYRDTLMVVSPISGGPSEKVGIRAGDRIIEVDGENIAGIGIRNTDVFARLKGKKGTKVNLKVLRRGSEQVLDFTIIRDKIPINSVEASYMATETVGYIKINQFSATTHQEVEESLKDLKKAGMYDLILDLRGNPGGYLRAAIQVADELFPDNQLIVFTQGNASKRKDHYSTASGLLKEGKVVVLINEGSASASEIVSGAIQDWDRGIILGRRSYGKGLVQRPLNLQDGSLIKLTIAKYYTPSGRCIQKPYDRGKDAYRNEILHRYEEGKVIRTDSVNKGNKPQFYTRTSKRPVYEGGGIDPDIYIPIDTTINSEYYRDLLVHGILRDYALVYVDKNRHKLELVYSSFSFFSEVFEVDEEMIEDLINLAKERKVIAEDKVINELLEIIKVQIKALIARSIWGSNEYFQVINPSVEMYKKALEILLTEERYNSILN
jgi:carboxyl-terminal processing protease